MEYNIFILRRAQKELTVLPSGTYENIRDTIINLAHNPRPHGCLKLTGRNGWRIRIGNYRVIYEINDIKHTATILHVGHRRDIYR
ncbi:MAG: type II toxin-antitoxin system RelE/ParE family toxin [Planctomycetes bacterium]|nr:type II toxin-antitoxin system RelE/ParE family toxin [Planctomycetota bacterium]